jgi:Protein of unknown function (DUF3326)
MLTHCCILHCGNSLSAQSSTLIIGVTDNTTVMKASAEALSIGTSSSSSSSSSSSNSVTVRSYLEAVGLLAAHKAGINPCCLTAHVPAIQQLRPQ